MNPNYQPAYEGLVDWRLATYVGTYLRFKDFGTIQVLAPALFEPQGFELAWDLADQVDRPLGRGPLSIIGTSSEGTLVDRWDHYTDL